MKIGKFKKSPADRKRYVVQYQDWMNEGETVVGLAAVGSVPDDDFYLDGYFIGPDALEIIFFVSGGLTGKSYDVTLTATTSLGQIKENVVTFVVI